MKKIFKIIMEEIDAFFTKSFEEIKIYETLSETGLVFGVYGKYNDYLKQVLIDKKIFKKEYFLSEALKELDIKCQNNQMQNSFLSDEENYSKLINFVFQNKESLYMYFLSDKNILSMVNDVFDKYVNDNNDVSKDEFVSFINNRYKLFFNLILEKSIDSGEINIQCRSQDSYIMFYYCNQKVFEKYIDELNKKFYSTISGDEAVDFFSSRLTSKTRNGIDWKICSNFINKFKEDFFTKKSMDMIVEQQESVLRDLKYKIANNALSNMDIINSKWRNLEWVLDYDIYHKNLMSFKNNISYYTYHNNNQSSELTNIINKIEETFLFINNPNEKIIKLNIDAVLYNYNGTLNYIKNHIDVINRMLKIFCVEKNPIIYDIEINCDKNIIRILSDNNLFNYVYNDFEKKIINNIHELIDRRIIGHTDKSHYDSILNQLMDECKELTLQNKLIESTLLKFEQSKNSNVRQKI